MKKIISNITPLGKDKVALVGVTKEGDSPATLAYAYMPEDKVKEIKKDATYEVEVSYHVTNNTTVMQVENMVRADDNTAKTQIYYTIATSATIVGVVNNNDKYLTLMCQIDDNNVVAATAWHNWNQGKTSHVQVGDKWNLKISQSGVFENGNNNISAFLYSNTSNKAEKPAVTTTTTTAVEQPVADASAKTAVKKFDFSHLKKTLEEKGYDKYQETGKIQMGFTTFYKDKFVYNIRDIKTFESIVNDAKLKELTSELARYTKGTDAEYDVYKKQLPCLFPMGYSVNNGAEDVDMKSNGLFFYDYDGHSQEEMQMGIDKIKNIPELMDNLVYLAKSPSLKGFHAIFLPFNDIDNINQNQIYVDKILQMPVKHDVSCKNLGRKKFLVPMHYIEYIRKDVFDLPINQRLTSIGNTKKYTQKIKQKNNKAKKTTPIAIDYGYPITEEEKSLIDVYINENDYIVGQRHSQLTALCSELGKNNYPIQRKEKYIEYIENKVKTFAAFDVNDEPGVRDENGVSELTSLLTWADNKGVIKNNVVPDEMRPRAFQDTYTWEDIVCQFNNIDYPSIIMDNLDTYFFEKNGHPSLEGHYFLPNQIVASAVMLTPHLSGVEILCPRKCAHSIMLQAIHCASSGKGKNDIQQNHEKGFGVVTTEECNTYNAMRAQAGKDAAALQEVAEKYRKDNMSIDSSYAALVDNLMRIETYNKGTAIAFTEEYDEITKKLTGGDNGIPTSVFRKGYDGGRLDKDTKTVEGTKGNPRCKLSMNACGTLGSLIPLNKAIGDADNGTLNRMMILPIVTPARLKKTDNQYYDATQIKPMIAYLRSLKNIVLDANYIFGGIHDELEHEYLDNYVKKMDVAISDIYTPIVGRAIANAERVATIYYTIWLFEQGLSIQPSNEPYTHITKSLRKGKEIEQPVTTVYNEQAYVPVCMDKDGNLSEIPVANDEIRQLFRVVFEMCVHGQYKLFDTMLIASTEKVEKTFTGITKEKKNISAKSEVFRRLPATFTREDVKQLYSEYSGTAINMGTLRNWISDWKKGNLVKEDENKVCTKI